ncbi:MAG: hypothetical protein IKR86_09860 [Candidatus Methanomethylophilaceae archaeon]|nr:hypothetical protein [Candidatus Methanomethylophilaceae archaeon]
MVCREGEGSFGRAKVPKPLLMGELFLCLVIVRYMMNFIIGLYIDVGSNWSLSIKILAMLFSLAMVLLAVSSVVGIASARPKSWRKVMRASIMLMMANTLYGVLDSVGVHFDGVVFDDLFLLVLTVLTLGLMLLPSVRRFYLPPLTNDPPLRIWIGYIFATPLFPDASYSFVTEDDRDKASDRRLPASASAAEVPRAGVHAHATARPR